MLLALIILVELVVDTVGRCQAVDEESSEELEVGSHAIAILPAIGHDLVDFVGTCCGLSESLTFLNQFIDLWRR